MKKLFLGFAAAVGLLCASSLVAANETDTRYHSKLEGPTTNFAVPATNITVLNYSEESIYVAVPSSPIYDMLPAGRSDTISNSSYYGDTRIVLQDWNTTRFFDQYVCRRAILTVDGRPGYYHITIDKKYC